MNVMKWLLDSDPAIRWQVMRDLTDEGDKAVAIERSRVATEGWGARLLAHQSPRGYWGRRDDPGWMTTVWSLALLKDLGADPESKEVRRAIGRVRKHITWHQHDGCGPYFDGETEPRTEPRAAYSASCSGLLPNRELRGAAGARSETIDPELAEAVALERVQFDNAKMILVVREREIQCDSMNLLLVWSFARRRVLW